jgi:hypothetical protein
MRYLVAHKINTLFEMKYTPACESIDLMLNGEYEGNYCLCDQMEEGKGRIDYNIVLKLVNNFLIHVIYYWEKK